MENSEVQKGKRLLKQLSENNSKIKPLADEVLEN